MFIYLSLIVFVVFFAYLAKMKGVAKTESRALLFIAFLAMVLVAGLRDQSVGTDSWSYVRYFGWIESIEDFLKYGSNTFEYGYWGLNWLLRHLSDQYVLLFTVLAVIVVGCYQKAIIDNSRNIPVSLFLFISMGFYTFFLNGARQGVACSICALALRFLVLRDVWRYLALIILASTFHKTALVMLPVYFLLRRENTYKVNISIGVLGVLGALILQEAVGIGSQFDKRYESFATSEEGGGVLIVLFYFLHMFFFLACKKMIRIDRGRYSIFLNMFVFGSVIALVSVLFRLNPSGILRLCVYFNIGAVFLWPILLLNIRDEVYKFYIIGIFVVFYVIFFILTTLRFSQLTPYSFNKTLNLF